MKLSLRRSQLPCRSIAPDISLVIGGSRAPAMNTFLTAKPCAYHDRSCFRRDLRRFRNIYRIQRNFSFYPSKPIFSMDALIESAGPLIKSRRSRPGPSSRPKSAPTGHNTVNRGATKEAIDPSTASILTTTRLPTSFHSSTLPTGSSTAAIRPDPSISHIKDKKLRSKIAREDVAGKRARIEVSEVNEWLNQAISGSAGGIEVDEDAGERTWRVRQGEIVNEVGVAGGRKKFDLKFEGLGEYFVDYTRNGRYLALASSLGHVATFDWQAGRLHSEIQLRETVRDIKWVFCQCRGDGL
jgi:U3 small nucleolar RNA-associated protein 7